MYVPSSEYEKEAMFMKARMHYSVQHRFNAVHVYSRLCTVMPGGMAMRISRVWEKVVHPIIY